MSCLNSPAQHRHKPRGLRREYDRYQAEKDFFETGYLDEGHPLVKLVMIELRTASSQLYCWANRYQELALAGHISMEESVRRYLAD